MEENKVVEVENTELNENNKVNWKIWVLDNLNYLLVILVGVIGLIVSIIKQFDLGLSECLIGLGVAQSQLQSYRKSKSKATLVCMILWYVVAALGLLSMILA